MSSPNYLSCLCFIRAVAVALAICLLSSSTPAAPQVIVALASESKVSLAFWFNSGGLRKLIQGSGVGNARVQEKQSDRDARVASIKIFPRNIVLHVDERINLAAVGYDLNGAPVGGLRFTWEARDETHGNAGLISPLGEFSALVPGAFRITAQGAGQQAQIIVTVLDGPRRPKPTDTPISIRPVSNAIPQAGTAKVSEPSSRADRASQLAAKSRRARSESPGRFAHTSASGPPMPLAPDDGWNDGNYGSSHDPDNGVGDPPGHPLDGGAGSGDFQIAAPIYSSAGRGININLAAAYNGRLWNKSGSQITYDIDRGWPAPGWSLGFGKLLSMGTGGGAMIVDADGTRHNYSGTITDYGSGNYG